MRNPLLNDSMRVRWAKIYSFFSSSFFMMLRDKNYQNRSVFRGVIKKIKVARIFETRCCVSTAWPKCDINRWIYPLIYPWISISTASLDFHTGRKRSSENTKNIKMYKCTRSIERQRAYYGRTRHCCPYTGVIRP